MEARDERRLRALQKHLNTVKLLILDELGYVPFTAVGSELLFEVFSQRYERGATLVTSNLPFDEWTSVFGSERLTGALLDRLTHQPLSASLEEWPGQLATGPPTATHGHLFIRKWPIATH
jgi:DNA replication protein DnaC